MIKIHPHIYTLILKCYYYIGNSSYEYFLEITNVLSLSNRFDLEKYKEVFRKNIKEDTRKDPKRLEEYESAVWNLNNTGGKVFESLLDYLKKLPNQDIFRILFDLLGDPKFEIMKKDNWNYYGDYVKEWPKSLIHLLETSGIFYDKEKREFISKKKEFDIQKAISIPDLIQLKFGDLFYRELAIEINKCYKFGAYTAVFVLSRKLIENLVIDVLRLKFPPNKENLKIYYRLDDRRFHDLTILIKNLEDKKDCFGIDKDKVEEFIRLIKPFRPSANSNTHSIIIFGEKEKIDSYQIERMTSLLLILKGNIEVSK